MPSSRIRFFCSIVTLPAAFLCVGLVGCTTPATPPTPARSASITTDVTPNRTDAELAGRKTARLEADRQARARTGWAN